MLSPSCSTQEKVGTSLASQGEKMPPYFSMPWALAVFHGNPFNLTNTVAMPRCFTVMLMKGIYYRCGYRDQSFSISADTMLLMTWGEGIKTGGRLFLSCLVIHTGPAYPMLLSAGRMGTLLCWVTLSDHKTPNPKIWYFFTFSHKKLTQRLRLLETLR